MAVVAVGTGHVCGRSRLAEAGGANTRWQKLQGLAKDGEKETYGRFAGWESAITTIVFLFNSIQIVRIFEGLKIFF